MSIQALRTLTQTAPRRAHPLLTRSLHFTPVSRASKPAHEPNSSQGHTVDKAHTPLHRDSDVQSASVRAGQDAKNKAEDKSTGAGEPLDAARMGNSGGESKKATGTGALKDQVGGQDVPGEGKGVEFGGEEVAAGGNITETIKSTITSGFDGLKNMRKDGRNFSTSARAFADATSPRTDPEGARKPVEKDVQGDQNAHLKHSKGGSDGSHSKGNASPDPSLPSKNKSSGSSSTQTRSFSTSYRTLADPNAPGVTSPMSAQKDAQKQTGLKGQPRGSAVEHGGASGAPTHGNVDATEKTADPTSSTATPDPEISKKAKEGSVKSGMGVRSFSTSSRVMADPNAPGVTSPMSSQKDAQKQQGVKTQARGTDAQHGGAMGTPSHGETDATEKTADPTSSTAAPDPEISKKAKEGSVKSGMGVRSFSTSSRVSATTPPGGYAKAHPHESSQAGYNAPPTALPSQLKSTYKENDPNAVQAAGADEIPSTKIQHSSTAVDPPNEALRQAVLNGTMQGMNQQPDTPGNDAGRQGIDEAWKHRK